MSRPESIEKALALPSGAQFHRCALQVNPHHYSATFRGQSQQGDPDSFARAMVDKAVELGVTVLGITDHNDVGSIPIFRAAAAGRGVHVFPGFELSSREGVHLLCLYPLESTQEQLGRFLGEFGIRNTSPSSDLASLSFVDVLAKVREQGGLAIAAHVTTEKGLLRALKGQSCASAWKSDELLAAQIPGPVSELPPEVRPIVENRNPDYKRKHPAGEGLALAVVNARDVTQADDLADLAATCWIKMSEVSVEGLRQAFLDPESRIRLNSAPKPEEHAEIVAISWKGGRFLDGAAIHFNRDLNVLVGGRGAGKSTIVESIRSALALDAVGDEARKAHEGIVRHVLRSGTQISLLVRTQGPAPREYVIERTIPNPSLVRDEHGEVKNLTPQDVLPRIEVYGQHEIAELAKSREKLTRLLDRFVERDDALRHDKSKVRRDLEKNRGDLLETRAELHAVEERLAALPGLEETLERFREAGLEERLSEQSLLVREERVLASIPERLAPFHECLEILRREIPIDRIFLTPRALRDLPGREIIGRADEILALLERELERLAGDLDRALRATQGALDGVREDWEVRKREVQAAYEEILRDLHKSRVDGEEFIRLRRQIEELRPLRERRGLLRRVEKEHTDRRRSLLAEWEKLKAEEVRRLNRAADSVNRELRGWVEVKVTAAGDREPLFQTLREIGGRLAETLKALKDAPDLSLTEFVESCRRGPDTLVTTYGKWLFTTSCG